MQINHTIENAANFDAAHEEAMNFLMQQADQGNIYNDDSIHIVVSFNGLWNGEERRANATIFVNCSAEDIADSI